jgi:hypothetical protein
MATDLPLGTIHFAQRPDFVIKIVLFRLLTTVRGQPERAAHVTASVFRVLIGSEA